MQVTTAMLADAARVESGKLFVHGGGWDNITAAAFPATQATMALVLVIRVEYDEALDDIPFVVDLLDEDDHVLLPPIEGVLNVGHAPGTRRGTPVFAPQALTFNLLQLEKAGGYRFRVSSRGEELASVPFRVTEAR